VCLFNAITKKNFLVYLKELLMGISHLVASHSPRPPVV